MLFACAGSCLTLLLPTENRDYGFALAIPFGFAQFIIAHSALSYFTATRDFAAVLALTVAPARYLLVDSNLSGEVDASCIMERNKRFMLIDTKKGSFNLVARSNGVDPFLGSHPLLQFHYPIIEIGEFSNFLVMSNDSEVSIDISTLGNQQSTRAGWSVADNAYGEYFYTSVEIRPSRSIKIPINPEKGWANFTLRRLNPSYSPAFLLLDGPLKVRISKP